MKKAMTSMLCSPITALFAVACAHSPGGDVVPGSVRAHAISAPDPDPYLFSELPVAELHGKVTPIVKFCVMPDGSTGEVEIDHPGDAAVDNIVVTTVKYWRFKPFIVDGKPKTTCTEAHFVIDFTGRRR